MVRPSAPLATFPHYSLSTVLSTPHNRVAIVGYSKVDKAWLKAETKAWVRVEAKAWAKAYPNPLCLPRHNTCKRLLPRLVLSLKHHPRVSRE